MNIHSDFFKEAYVTMAPLEDFHSRDLAWISEFVMQQVIIMMRPMMEQMQQTDASVDYAHRSVQRLGADISEVRGDVERTNKCLTILRQGLGVQNESKCMLQRGLDSSTRTAKRLDDQMDSMLTVIRGLEDSISQICTDMRGAGIKHEELAKLVAEKSSNMEDLQAKVERVSTDAHSMKDGLLSSEARLEVWQRELRDIRRIQHGMVPKFDDKTGRPLQSSRGAAVPDSWPQKKHFPTSADLGGAPAAASSPGSAANGISDCSNRCGSKRIARLSGSGRVLLQQDFDAFAAASPQVYDSLHAATEADENILGTGCHLGAASFADEAIPSNSRLPLLASSRQSGIVTRPPEGSYTSGPRLRFSETMVKPPSRSRSPA